MESSLHRDHRVHFMPGHVAEVPILAGLGRRKVNLGDAIGRDEDPLQSFRPKFWSPVTSHGETFSREQSDRHDGMDFRIVVFEHEPRFVTLMEDRSFGLELPSLNHYDGRLLSGYIRPQRKASGQSTRGEEERA